jgi:predicted O-linked N-acetylglucosamine transferase (SPINDLY family)
MSPQPADDAERLCNEGETLLSRNDCRLAEAFFREALLLSPKLVRAHYQLGIALRGQGLLVDAWYQWRSASELAPDDTRFLVAASAVLLHLPDFLNEGITWLKSRVAGTRGADHPDLLQNMGALYLRAHSPESAATCFGRLTELIPSSADAWLGLGNVQKEQGKPDAALVSYQKALTLNPDHAGAASQCCFVSNLIELPPQDRLQIAQHYGQIISRDVTPYSSWRCEPSPQKLRVGLVSGDLYRHPVAFFLRSTLEALSNSNLELIAYQTQPFTDDWTKQLHALFASWRDISRLSDAQAADQIHGDAPHVLIDLSGHTAYNRLPVFARRPAPVQISWLGYFGSTGVPAIDFLLVDPIGGGFPFQQTCCETLLTVPQTRFCFTVPDDAPEVSLRAPDSPMVFGSFAQTSKITEGVVDLWSEVLGSCPDAKLRVQNRALQEPETVMRLIGLFESRGMSKERLVLLPGYGYTSYLKAYGEVDLILDTHPYSGGTTTCEALWMGVPTLTLFGDTLIARQSASILAAAGLSQWIAESRDEFIAKAVKAYESRSGLINLRETLREKLVTSAMFDSESFARDLESGIWETWGLGRNK